MSVPQWDGVMREVRAPLQPLHTMEVLSGTSVLDWTQIILVKCLWIKWFSTHWHHGVTGVVFPSQELFEYRSIKAYLHNGAGGQYFLFDTRVICWTSHCGKKAHGILCRNCFTGSRLSTHDYRLVLLISAGESSGLHTETVMKTASIWIPEMICMINKVHPTNQMVLTEQGGIYVIYIYSMHDAIWHS